MADCAAATAVMAICSRSQGSCSIRQMKPRFSMAAPPSRFSAGTRTLSKNSSEVSCARRPSFFSRLPTEKPGMPRSTSSRLVPLAPACRIGLGHDDDQVGVPAVGDEGLAAVEQVAAVGLLDGRGLDALQVRPRGRFAHGDGADHLAAGQLGQVLLFLRLGAVVQDVGRDDLAVQAVADAGDAGARQLFELDHRIQLVRVGTAIFLGHGHAQEAVLAGLVPDRAVHIALLFPGLMEGRDFLVDEAAESCRGRLRGRR